MSKLPIGVIALTRTEGGAIRFNVGTIVNYHEAEDGGVVIQDMCDRAMPVGYTGTRVQGTIASIDKAIRTEQLRARLGDAAELTMGEYEILEKAFAWRASVSEPIYRQVEAERELADAIDAFTERATEQRLSEEA